MKEYNNYISIVRKFERRLENCTCGSRRILYLNAIQHFSNLAYGCLHNK
jgi:hypothetical protein